MSVYYVQRNPGGPVEGPIGQGRLARELTEGHLSPAALLCVPGTEEWIESGDILYAVIDDIERANVPQSPGIVPRLVSRPYFWASVLLFFVGLFFLFSPLWWAIGILLVIGSHFIDRKYYRCAHCGNSVEKHSAVCPTCRARLVTEREYRRNRH
jgi:DNA-directed RNA polymerase subunit RPC12/RpoP